jgi:signal transduction histidine kinase
MTAADRRRIAWWIVAALAVCAALSLSDVAATVVSWRMDRDVYVHAIGEGGEIAYWLGWLPLAPLVFFLARRVPFRRDRWAVPLAFHLVTSVIITTAARVALTNLGAVYLGGARWADMPGLLTPFWAQYALYCAVSDTVIYWLILAAGIALVAWDEGQARRRHAADLQRALVAAQVDALKMKLQPHFLFNTLNSIAFLAVEKDAAAVVMFVERLGNLLRSSMQSGASQLVTVGEELALLDEYLSIEEVRFADRLRVVRHIAPAALHALIPSLVLQPVIENSIKHGFSRRIDASRLEIAIRREGRDLVVTVEDDGPGVPPEWDLATRCGRGLKNVIERLDKLYPGAWAFTLKNRPGGGAVARLRMPWQTKTAPEARPLPALGLFAASGR